MASIRSADLKALAILPQLELNMENVSNQFKRGSGRTHEPFIPPANGRTSPGTLHRGTTSTSMRKSTVQDGLSRSDRGRGGERGTHRRRDGGDAKQSRKACRKHDGKDQEQSCTDQKLPNGKRVRFSGPLPHEQEVAERESNHGHRRPNTAGFSGQCYSCGKEGHRESQCPQKRTRRSKHVWKNSDPPAVRAGLQEMADQAAGASLAVDMREEEFLELMGALRELEARSPPEEPRMTEAEFLAAIRTETESDLPDDLVELPVFDNMGPHNRVVEAGFDEELGSGPGLVDFWWEEKKSIVPTALCAAAAVAAAGVGVGLAIAAPFVAMPVAAVLATQGAVLSVSTGVVAGASYAAVRAAPQTHRVTPRFAFGDQEEDRRLDAHALTDIKHQEEAFVWDEEVGPTGCFPIRDMLGAWSHSDAQNESPSRSCGLSRLCAAGYRYVTGCFSRRKLTTSNAIVRELSAYRNTSPYAEPAQVRERLDYAARSISSVNFDGRSIMTGDSRVEDSVQVALHLYLDRQRRRGDFHIAL